ncbi:glutaminase [Sporohalobacter salinus]|nr:glutaminase [Sporohalobacter salinus]MBM7624852.1 glutaminase [Sporohalobacter salinus]
MASSSRTIEGDQKLQKVLERVLKRNKHYYEYGSVARYIPALTRADPRKVGISILNINGESFNVGDYQTKFSIQSLSKIVTLILALLDNGKRAVFNKVGMEPSGKSFNAIESMNELNKPFNPMINAGAIAVTSMIKGRDNRARFERIMNFFKKLAKSNKLELDNQIYLSEKETGNRNRTLAYYMKEI